MPNRALWTSRRVSLVVVVAALVITGVAWRVWAPRPAPETVLRSDVVLRDGVLYKPTATVPFAGLLVERWTADRRRVEVTIVDGRAHGRSRGWYENGQIEVEEHFVRGVSHGTRTRWFPEGGKKSEVKIVDGTLAGVFREWHANGRLARETPLAAGVPHGEAKSWDPAGKLIGTAQVSRGKKISE